MATAAGDEPVQLLSGSAMDFTGSGPGAFQVSDPNASTMAETLSGNIAAGQSLEIQAPQDSSGNRLDTVTAAGSFTNAGTITFDYTTQASGGREDSVELALPTGDALTNTGKIAVSGSGDGGYATQWNQTIDGDVVNDGIIDAGITGSPVAYLDLGASSSLTNHGSINIGAGDTINVPGSMHNLTDGSIAIAGGASAGLLTVSGTFEQGAGTVATGSGFRPVTLTNGSSMEFTGDGTGAFQVSDANATPMAETLSGNIAVGQSLEIQAPQSGPSDPLDTMTATGSFTNAGTLVLDWAPAGGETSVKLALPSGDTLTNTGTINAVGNGIGSYSGQWNQQIAGNLDNQGILDVGTGGLTSYLGLSGHGLTNSGTINIGSAAGASSTLGTVGSLSQTGGSVNVATGAAVDASGAGGGFALSGGVLTGSGRIAGNLTQTGGTIAPLGMSGPGTLRIGGAYTEEAGGTLAIPIDGTGSGQYSVLADLGSASVSGTLSLEPSASYQSTAQPGDSDPILTSGGALTGDFSSATVAPQNTAPPTISGGTAEGDVLTCAPGSFTDTPTSPSYVWSRNGAAISGANADTYTLVRADLGQTLTCTETVTAGAALNNGRGFNAQVNGSMIDAVVGTTFAAGSTSATSAGTTIPLPANASTAVLIPTTSIAAATDHEPYAGTAITACGGTTPSCEVYSPSAGTLVDSSGNSVAPPEQYAFTVSSGSLPAGMTLSSQGYLYGTPTQSGSFQFAVVATDPNNHVSAPASFTLTVNAAPAVTLTPATLPAAVGASSYGAAITACGGVEPSCQAYSSPAGRMVDSSGAAVPSGQQFTFATIPADLPPGLNLSINGYLTGTPTQTGTYQFPVIATDPAGDSSTAENVSLTVTPGIAITSGSFHLAGTLAAGAAIVTPGSSGGVGAVSVGASAPATVSGSGVPSGTNQVSLQIGHDQTGDCVTELQLGGAGGVQFDAPNLVISGCDTAVSSESSASVLRHSGRSARIAAHPAAVAQANPVVAGQVSQGVAQAAIGAASDCSGTYNGLSLSVHIGGGTCTVTQQGSGYRITGQFGVYTSGLNVAVASTQFQLNSLIDAAGSVPPLIQVSPLTTLVDSYATGLAASGTPLSVDNQDPSQVLMSAYGFPSGTTAAQTIPSFAAQATGNASSAVSTLQALEAAAQQSALTDRGSLVAALATEISQGQLGTVTEPLGSGTLPVSAGTSLFQAPIPTFEADYADSVPSLAPAGTTIKQALPVLPVKVTLPIVAVPVPVGSITKIGAGAFTETVTASSPLVSTAPFPTGGGASFTIEVVS